MDGWMADGWIVFLVSLSDAESSCGGIPFFVMGAGSFVQMPWCFWPKKVSRVGHSGFQHQEQLFQLLRWTGVLNTRQKDHKGVGEHVIIVLFQPASSGELQE